MRFREGDVDRWPAVLFTLVLLSLGLLILRVPDALEMTPPAYRRWVFYAVPVALLAMGAPFAWGLEARAVSLSSRLGRAATALWAAVILVAVGLSMGGILAAYGLGWTYFTYADHSLYVSLAKRVFVAIPFAWAAGVGWEWVLRRVLVERWRRAGHVRAGWTVALLLGLLLSLPQVFEGWRVLSGPYSVAGVFRLLCLEAACTALVARGPGVVWAGLYRGVHLFLAVWALNDWYSPLFPAANYVSSGTSIHVLYSAGPLAALVWIGAAVAWRSRHEETSTAS